jgi:hypothetical protein
LRTTAYLLSGVTPSGVSELRRRVPKEASGEDAQDSSG